MVGNIPQLGSNEPYKYFGFEIKGITQPLNQEVTKTYESRITTTAQY